MSNSQEDKLIQKALVLETNERTQFLNKIEDNQLKQKIAFLLNDDKAATQFVLETSIGVDLSDYIHIKDLNSGDKIKQFTIVRLLAKGGMGSVYLAYDGKLKRNVAIKTIRSEYLKNQASQQRFKREAQILSQINHPSICQIYEYIDYEDGDVLVLELVNGKTLSSLELTEKQKLDVFIQIASALVVAHEKDIIHRDLKPDNIMLTNDREVKILDFGIAKSKGETIQEIAKEDEVKTKPKTQKNQGKLTQMGTMMGTLLYMSPEQAQGKIVTKASDVYSFGIIMQEILTGVAFYEFSNTVELREQVLNGRNVNTDLMPKKFQVLIRAMTQKNPQARPNVVAVSAKLNEVFEKPKRRLKRIIIATILLIALAGFIKYTYDLKQEKTKAELARAEAVLAQEKSEYAKNEAEQAKIEAEQITEFLESLFRVSDPYSKQGKTITAQQMLNDGAKRLDIELKDQPHALVRLKIVIGEVYRKMGLYHSSRKQFEEAANLFEKGLINDVELHIKLLGLMVSLTFETDRYDDMEKFVNLIIKLSEDNNLTNKDYYLTAKFNRAVLYDERGDYKKATKEYEALLQIYNKNPKQYTYDIVSLYNALGLIHAEAMDSLVAKDYMEKALLLLSPNENEDLESKSVLLGNLATILSDQKLYPEAIEATLSVIKLRAKLFDNKHPLLALGYDNLAKLYCEVKEYKKCIGFNNKAIEMYQQTSGNKSIKYALALRNKAVFIGKSSQNYLQAEPILQQSLELITAVYGKQHRLVADTLTSMGENYLYQEKYPDAQKKLQLAINIYSKLERPMKDRVVDAWLTLANVYEKQESSTLALQTYKDMLVKLENEKSKDKKLIAEIQQKISDLK